ncbi:MATE efflux family protein [Prevotella amnii]|uniref:Multidrug export protein MepA n=2 Tax=Prevotella amnii TaxID=419005 RepID=A0A134BPU8_9BACT|nr:MATE family efflux transporter [Prevotella amnii]EFN91309.1 MATE efflux family protein [Prevotella amnii CRIS 21A-A]KXB81975.1 MATE efflux family protein [Prevotella amnii]
MDNKKATLELGTKPIGKLLLQYALPAIIAMIAASLYNIIDRVFIGQYVGPMAISGLAITFPFMNLGAAFGAAIGVGASTTISVKLGQRDYDTAENLLGNTIILNLIVGLSFGIISLIFLNPILHFFGASHTTLPYAKSFMQIILAGNVVSHMYLGMNAVLRASSKPRHAMLATIFTVVMNIILDAIFICWLGWGIEGAAIATIISQALALCWQMSLFADKSQILHFKKGIYRLKKQLVNNIISVGISPFFINLCACIIVIFMNNQLVRYGGDMAVGAYGIANSIATIFIMFVIGLNQGMQPIAGYNYGAQNISRLLHVLKLTIIAATIVMTIGWLLSIFAPYYCARLFTTDAELIKLSIKAIRINMMMYLFIGSQMVTTFFFLCVGKVKTSIFLSLSRQLLVLLPALYILPQFFHVNGVWYSLPVSDFTAWVIAISILVWYIKKIKTNQNNTTNQL